MTGKELQVFREYHKISKFSLSVSLGVTERMVYYLEDMDFIPEWHRRKVEELRGRLK